MWGSAFKPSSYGPPPPGGPNPHYGGQLASYTGFRGAYEPTKLVERRLFPNVLHQLRSAETTKLVLAMLAGVVLLPLPLLLEVTGYVQLLTESPKDRVGNIGALFAVGLVTWVSACPLLYAWSLRRRMQAIERVFAELQRAPRCDALQLATALATTPLHARHLLFDAINLGLVEESLAALAAGAQPVNQAYGYAAGPPTPGPVATPQVVIMTANDSSGSGPVTQRAQASGPATADDLRAGDVLGGRYELLSLLGSGGMGHVFVARQTRTNRKYALKVMRTETSLATGARARFEREAKLAGSLGHPGIVAVHDYDETPAGLRYLVMDLLHGETLDARLERQRTLPFEEALRIACEVASALGTAHAQGLVHRDIKPPNIFLVRDPDGSERAVVLDFGVVKDLKEQCVNVTSTGMAVGTPFYMAPEQALGHAVDARVDVYALGCVIYEMLSGEPPFVDDRVAQLITRLLTEAPAPISQLAPCAIPHGFDAVVARALAKTPAERTASMQDFAAALFTFKA
jgi:tRNA A-37 threonylcarbamoyl transferase component Bud32